MCLLAVTACASPAHGRVACQGRGKPRMRPPMVRVGVGKGGTGAATSKVFANGGVCVRWPPLSSSVLGRPLCEHTALLLLQLQHHRYCDDTRRPSLQSRTGPAQSCHVFVPAAYLSSAAECCQARAQPAPTHPRNKTTPTARRRENLVLAPSSLRPPPSQHTHTHTRKCTITQHHG